MGSKLLNIFLYYSAVLMTVLIIAGFFVSRSTRDFLINIMFLPVVVFLWISIVQKFRKPKT